MTEEVIIARLLTQTLWHSLTSLETRYSFIIEISLKGLKKEERVKLQIRNTTWMWNICSIALLNNLNH